SGQAAVPQHRTAAARLLLPGSDPLPRRPRLHARASGDADRQGKAVPSGAARPDRRWLDPRWPATAIAEQHFCPVSRRAHRRAREPIRLVAAGDRVGHASRRAGPFAAAHADPVPAVSQQLHHLGPAHRPDLGLLSWLWRKILSGREIGGPFRASWAWPVLGLALSASAVLFSWTAATFPGEWQEDYLPNWRIIPTSDDTGKLTKVSLHDWVFNGPVDDTTRRRKSLFSSTLVLPGLNIYEGLNIDDPEKAKWRDFVFRARGDLRGAIFDLASLPKVDFDGAELRGASFEGAHLQGASLDEAKLQGASLVGSALQGASLDRAELQGVSLKGAHLEGASLNAAQLQVAFLVGAQLQGASLNEAELQGASLYSARLQGASLDNAQLQGASLVDAQLQGALLDTTQLQGASLDRAQLAGADLNAAHLEGASLFHARLQGALLQAAVLRATDLSYAYLWRTNRGARSYVGAHWYVNDVKLSGAQWQPS